jgi:sugar lactone lactonase YvrE
MTVSPRLRLIALLAGVLTVLLSTTVQASGTLTRVLTTSAPNLPESIAIDHKGNFYLSFPFAGTVVKVHQGSLSTIAMFPGMNPLGVRLDDEGNVFVAVPGSGIWEVPANGGGKRQVASGPGLWNGLAFDQGGNLFVSDSHNGAIWRLDENGAFTLWSGSALLQGTTGAGPCGLVHPAVPSFGPLGANGIEFNKRGDLLVNNTDLGTVVRIPVDEDGSAGAASVLAGPSCDLWGADGIAVDIRDNVYVAANSKGQIDRVNRHGAIQVLATGDPLNFPSDIAFGTRSGDRKQIYISNFAAFATSTGAPGVLKMDVGIRGRPLGESD